MIELLSKGGLVMYPILLGSVLGLALFLERLVALRRSRVNPPDLLQQLLLLIRTERLNEARGVCQGHNSALARLMRVALNHEGESREEIKNVLEDSGQREAHNLERGVGALGAVASLEPLMGLLGTVLGMISAFRQVEAGGVGDPKAVAGGVWIALITTAVGLIIAIPCYVGYRILLARVDSLVLELQEDTLLLVEAMVRPNSPQFWSADYYTPPPPGTAPPTPAAPPTPPDTSSPAAPAGPLAEAPSPVALPPDTSPPPSTTPLPSSPPLPHAREPSTAPPSDPAFEEGSEVAPLPGTASPPSPSPPTTPSPATPLQKDPTKKDP